MLRILDSADTSPGDGLAIARYNGNSTSCKRLGAIFVDTYGKLSYSNLTVNWNSLSGTSALSVYMHWQFFRSYI